MITIRNKHSKEVITPKQNETYLVDATTGEVYLDEGGSCWELSYEEDLEVYNETY